MAKITVGVPSYNGVKTETALSLILAVSELQKNHDVHLAFRSGPYTHWNREDLAEDSLDATSDYLMMVDTDLVFPPDGVTKLLGRKKDIIGGLYMERGSIPPVNTIRLADDDGNYVKGNLTTPTEPFRVAAIATGFMLVKTTVFQTLTQPWFPCVRPVGEDIAFCQLAVTAGFEVWCDPTFLIQHLGDYPY